MLELFGKSDMVGSFKGCFERGLEFAAEIIVPYAASMLDKPQLGQFLLIELGNPTEAVLCRITRVVPTGMLATAEGEDYMNTMQRRDMEVPEELKKDKLKYRVAVKLLGSVRIDKPANQDERIVFVPSHRRLPHLGAKVALPSETVLRELCCLSGGSTVLGYFALGEFVYSGAISSPHLPYIQHISPKLPVKFNVANLVAKRSVVFARAGYGKSNLIKYLISELYKDDGRHAVTEQDVKVGTLIFDADGEYFWPDSKGRPGFCDVPHLKDQVVLFTNRKKDSHYDSWIAGRVKLDIRELPARDVVGVAVSGDRQNQQNILKLKGLPPPRWRDLVDLICEKGLQAEDSDVGKIMGYAPKNPTMQAEVAAAKSNMNAVVNLLHDPDSKLITFMLDSLKQGKVVIVDISLLSSTAGNNIAGLLMRRIFNDNQANFTAESGTIPVNVVIEEAQSVLGKRLDESSPFVEWIKEGRKYDLGAILVTQQPGSLAPEIMSQADNWFVFHLLSAVDTETLGRYNSHFSSDVLSHIIGEPIRGNCYMWSAPDQPFVLPVRILNFEKLHGKHVVAPNSSDERESVGKKLEDALGERNKRLAAHLKKILQKSMAQGRLHPSIRKDGVAMGIRSGQLYYLMKEAKTFVSDEVRKEDELKLPVLHALFGVAPDIEGAPNAPSAYFWIPRADWERVMSEKS